MEDDPVVDLVGGDLHDPVEHVFGFVAHRFGLQVDVPGGPADVERCEEHPAFQDERSAFPGLRESIEEPLEDVELEQFLDCSSVVSGLVLQVEVGASPGCVPRRGHSSTSRALRSGASALLNWRAMAIS